MALFDNQVHYWACNENTGTTTDDAVGSMDLTLTNSLGWYTTGKFGACLYANGGTYYASHTDDSSLQLTGNFSVSCWVAKTSGGNRTVLSKWTGSTSGGYEILTGNSGEVYFRTSNGSSNYDTYTSYSNWIPADGTWHLIVVTHDSSNVGKVYIDGTDRTAAGGNNPCTASTVDFTVGTRSDKGGEHWYGYVDDVRMWTRTLSATDVSDLYAYTPSSAVVVTPSPITFKTSQVNPTVLIQGSATVIPSPITFKTKTINPVVRRNSFWGILKRWSGSEWAITAVKAYNSSDWINKPVYMWDGSDWRLIETQVQDSGQNIVTMLKKLAVSVEDHISQSTVDITLDKNLSVTKPFP